MAVLLAEHADPPVDINRVVMMLLSQGARRAIEMKRDADNGSTDPAVPAIPAAAEARPS